jgi:hypothetical protein
MSRTGSGRKRWWPKSPGEIQNHRNSQSGQLISTVTWTRAALVYRSEAFPLENLAPVSHTKGGIETAGISGECLKMEANWGRRILYNTDLRVTHSSPMNATAVN